MVLRRNSYPEKIAAAFNQVSIVVLLGARQVGKTSIMRLYAADKKSLFLNGQNPDEADLFQQLSIIETWLAIHLDPHLEGLLLIDEFQFINGISTMLKLLADKYPALKILCSGSSSLDILQHVEESLAGRVRVIEVLSLSLEEYLMFNDERLAALYRTFTIDTEASALTAPINALLEEYLVYGGLPRGALTKNPDEKIEILNDIYQTYLLKDIRTYIEQKNSVGFNRMLRLLALQIGNLLNVNTLSQESELPYKVCAEYLYILEQMGIIKLIEPFFSNNRRAVIKMKKIYFCDLGLRNLLAKNVNPIENRADNGALFENYVMLELWRNRGTGGELQFYRTSDGTEVDFVMSRWTQKTAIECKFKAIKKPMGLAAFNRFCDEQGIANRVVINRVLNTARHNTRYLPGILAPLVTI